MPFDRSLIDEQAFGQTERAGSDVGRLVGGEPLAQRVDADSARGLRARIEHWAKARGLLIEDSMIVHAEDGVAVRAPLYLITEGTVIVRGTAAQPVKMSLVIEPRTWTHRLRARFGGKAFTTGDVGFDRGWHVEASEPAAAAQIVDDTYRETLRDAACWCRAVYDDGAIEIRLDAEGLAGTHVLSGIELVLLLARARVAWNAYR